METMIGDKGLNTLTFQEEFPEEVECAYCGGMARPAFAMAEGGGKGDYICDLHKNEPKGSGFWVHDACAVAVYFCRKCLKPTAEMNQG